LRHSAQRELSRRQLPRHRHRYSALLTFSPADVGSAWAAVLRIIFGSFVQSRSESGPYASGQEHRTALRIAGRAGERPAQAFATGLVCQERTLQETAERIFALT